MLDNLQDFLGVFLSPLSSSAAPLLCPRYRPSYPTRGCANYIGGRESASRPTIEIACRLSVWPPQPFPPSLLFLLYHPLYPRSSARFSTGDNKQYKHPMSTASQRQQSRRQSYCPRLAIRLPRLLRVRGRATTIVRPENEHDYDDDVNNDDNEDDDRRWPPFSWKT